MGKKDVYSRVTKGTTSDPTNKFLYNTESLTGHSQIGPTHEPLASYSAITEI